MSRVGLFAALLAIALQGIAAELKVISGNGAGAAIRELSARFERESGHRVALHFHVNVEAKRRIEAGEPFDAAILNPPVLDDLIRQGKVIRETRAVLGRAGIGVAVREGAPRPDISTVAGFKRALLGRGRGQSAGCFSIESAACGPSSSLSSSFSAVAKPPCPGCSWRRYRQGSASRSRSR